MIKPAANIYQPNAALVRLHQRIAELRRGGLLQQEIAETVHLSLTAVRYHLRDNCNCKNGGRAADAAAVTSRQAQG